MMIIVIIKKIIDHIYQQDRKNHKKDHFNRSNIKNNDKNNNKKSNHYTYLKTKLTGYTVMSERHNAKQHKEQHLCCTSRFNKVQAIMITQTAALIPIITAKIVINTNCTTVHYHKISIHACHFRPHRFQLIRV